MAWASIAPIRTNLADSPSMVATMRAFDPWAIAPRERQTWAQTRADLTVLERVDALGKARGVPSAQVAFAWLLQQPGITAPIIGATKMQHLDDAIAALSVKLTDEEARLLEEPYVPHAVSGFS